MSLSLSNLLPFYVGICIFEIRRDLLCRFPDNFEAAKHSARYYGIARYFLNSHLFTDTLKEKDLIPDMTDEAVITLHTR